MNRRYAEGTGVDIHQSQQELSTLLRRQGADQVVLAWDATEGAGVRFKMAGRYAQLMVSAPSEKRLKELKLRHPRTPEQERIEAEQRRCWRALLLLVKAKLEAIASGITTAEREFMPDLLMQDGRRLEQWALPALETRQLAALPEAVER
jgi:hypothetical protein